MPIISFNISHHLKEFLKRMVGSNEYKNNSYVMRDALVRLMHEKEDAAVGETSASSPNAALEQLLPKITSSVLISLDKFNSKLDHKLNRLESSYHRTVLHKSTYCYDHIKTVTYILEDSMNQIQSFITELNSIEDLSAFRYIINEPTD